MKKNDFEEMNNILKTMNKVAKQIEEFEVDESKVSEERSLLEDLDDMKKSVVDMMKVDLYNLRRSNTNISPQERDKVLEYFLDALTILERLIAIE